MKKKKDEKPHPEIRSKEDLVALIADKAVELADMKEEQKKKKKELEALVESYRASQKDEQQTELPKE